MAKSTLESAVSAVQSELNKLGHKLTVDGDPGPKTIAALKLEYSDPGGQMPEVKPSVPVKPQPAGGKPTWVQFLEKEIGWSEKTHDKDIAKDWGLVGLPQYKTIKGKNHAWCGLEAARCLHYNGLKYPKGAAGARNWEDPKNTWSVPCDYVCGAFLPMRHASGGRHITVFLYWVDEKKKIAACLGGNQGDSVRITKYNLSGNKAGKEEIVGGPRWPKEYPKSVYKYLTKGGESDGSKESTR